MKTMTELLSSKECRSNSCLERTKTEKFNENRTFSLTEQSQTNSNATFHSSTESIQRHSTPKHELYRLQKQTYQNVKKRFTNEVDQLLKDSSIIIVSDWLKVRGTFRDWTKLWAVLKPGLILFYRDLNGLWVGTLVLSSCQVIQRPTKKSGFCFKIWHPLEKSIWSQRGPNNEQFGALTFPLPMSYLICRASDETAGRCWMDALELTMKCSKLLQRPFSTLLINDEKNVSNPNLSENDSDFQHEKDDVISDTSKISRSGTTQSDCSQDVTSQSIVETNYILAPAEEMGELGDASQTEDVAEENKSLIIHLLKQIRPGMDLSKVVLPTFILEPRSFLEKLSDYYYHCDILEEAGNSSDPLERMKIIVKFYLSGFYKKPKGLKKPYNPLLGEVYRCYFHHPKSNSKTFYIAEQVSHHPPITNFYVSNRQEGFCIQGSILARSKFYGNSLSALLDGSARITLLNKGEDYVITMPYANCKGILIGRLTMELGGKVTINCEKTGYSAEIDFKLKPFIGGHDLMNLIEGKIRFEKNVLYTFSGHWNDEIIILDKTNNIKTSFWKVTQSVIDSRLKRYVVPIEQQQENESEKLWQYVTTAVRQNDQISATEEKTLLENEQRKRRNNGNEWCPKIFRLDPRTREWTYNHVDTRPWDSHNDISTYEHDFFVCTRTSHRPPIPKISETNFDHEIITTLKRVEQNLVHTIERIEYHEKQLDFIRTSSTRTSQLNFVFSYVHFILIVLVAFILKFIFR